MLLFLTSFITLAAARQVFGLPRILLNFGSVELSRNVSSCPGYTLSRLHESSNGLTAKLSLAGPACNAFGTDVANLTIQVSYESKERLHVQIFDDDQKQYTIPSSVLTLPRPSAGARKATSDLVFNYESKPFSFWITRRSRPDLAPLFDTRIKSLPKTPVPPVKPDDNRTGFDAFPLVFEDQYLQLASALPLDTNIYGLGEVVASSGFRRSANLTIQTMWARDIANPIDENIYGSHPFYLEHRYNSATGKSTSHGVFLLNAAGSDILIATPPGSSISVIEYRLLGGVLDFYFFSGPTPQSVVEQYGKLIGLPTWQPVWGFGFQLCRWGYHDIKATREQVDKMREANIPLEVMWNDIDLYHAVRDFTVDPVSFPAVEMKKLTDDLHAANQKYIPIVDAAIAKQSNASDLYDPYIKGAEQKVFIANPDGSEYIGQVWPGYTARQGVPGLVCKEYSKLVGRRLGNLASEWSVSPFPKRSLLFISSAGVGFDGIWLDMNEASSFCDGSCGTGANLSDTSPPFTLPGDPGNPVTDWPECYNPAVSGTSGNITVNGTMTCQPASSNVEIAFRGLGAGGQTGVDLNEPPYAIHNANGRLSIHTLATNATHANGVVELDVHNLWGLQEAKATHLALQEIHPNKRPFIISRSTFPSAGRWTGHWLGDNFSKWQYMYLSIQGVLQFQLFQIPFVGADTCGFVGNTDEELCARWMELSAFTPFYRNHNIRGAIPQEPYRWDTVASASRQAIAVRYSLLPYWYTLFATASTHGTPPVRPLFFEFPNQPELFGIDRQFLIGGSVLVTPVLDPNVTTVQGVFPGKGRVAWRDWYTHELVDTSQGTTINLAAPLEHINVHVREGSIILLHAKPAYTIAETRAGPYSLLAFVARDGTASGSAFVDDGESLPPTPSKTLTFTSKAGQLAIAPAGSYHIGQKLQSITILGLTRKPHQVSANSVAASWTFNSTKEELVITKLALDLNRKVLLHWS